jgi:hypothetical protein
LGLSEKCTDSSVETLWKRDQLKNLEVDGTAIFREKLMSHLLKNTCLYTAVIYDTVCVIKYKEDKAIPLQALTGPEGSRRLRLPDFKTIGT